MVSAAFSKDSIFFECRRDARPGSQRVSHLTFTLDLFPSFADRLISQFLGNNNRSVDIGENKISGVASLFRRNEWEY